MTLPTHEQVKAVFDVVLYSVFACAVVVWFITFFAKMIRDYWNGK